MYKEIKERFCRIWRELPAEMEEPGLSLRDAGSGVYAVRPRECPAEMTVADVLVVDEQGLVLEGIGEPEPSFVVHRAVYALCPTATAVLEPRSRWSGVWAQLGRTLPPTSFLHVRHFFGEVPCTGAVIPQAGEDVYAAAAETVTGTLTRKEAATQGAVFLRNDGAILWGDSPETTVERAAVLEELCLRELLVAAVNQGADNYVARQVAEALYEKK